MTQRLLVLLFVFSCRTVCHRSDREPRESKCAAPSWPPTATATYLPKSLRPLSKEPIRSPACLCSVVAAIYALPSLSAWGNLFQCSDAAVNVAFQHSTYCEVFLHFFFFLGCSSLRRCVGLHYRGVLVILSTASGGETEEQETVTEPCSSAQWISSRFLNSCVKI